MTVLSVVAGLFAIQIGWTATAHAQTGACEDLILGSSAAAEPVEPIEIPSLYKNVAAWLEPQSRSLPAVSIIIPAFREEKRLPGSILKIKDFLARYPLPVEVLVMVEKSPDRTVEVGQAAVGFHPQIEVIDNQVQRGKGYAVRSGMARARGAIALFMDADLSTPLYEIIRFLEHLRTHPETDVVIGDRVRAIAADRNQRSALRHVLTKGFKAVMHMASPLEFEDTQAGFKAFRRSAMTEIFSRQTIDGFAFDVEILILAKELGLKTDAVSIDWVDDRRSTVRPFIDPIKMLVDIVGVQSAVRKNLAQSTKATLKESL